MQEFFKTQKDKGYKKEIYINNERKYREEIKNKYSAEKVMQKRNEDCNKSKFKENRVANEREDKKQANEKYLVEYKESIFKKIINKIKKFLKRK